MRSNSLIIDERRATFVVTMGSTGLEIQNERWMPARRPRDKGQISCTATIAEIDASYRLGSQSARSRAEEIGPTLDDLAMPKAPIGMTA